MKFSLRPSRHDDEPQLRALWSTVFGDGNEFLNPFFETLYPCGGALVCDFCGKIIASVYPLNIGDIVTEADRAPCIMIYALGTLPEYRGMGCASALMNACTGSGTYILHPANKELFDFYESLGYKTCFYFKDKTLTADMISPANSVRAERISADEYNALRNRLLAAIPHIEYNASAVKFEEFLCSDGGLFRLSGRGFSGICAAERYLNTAYVKELLVPDEYYSDAVSAIAKAVPADKYRIRSIAGNSQTASAFGMAKSDAAIAPGWYGFAFD